MYQPYVSLTHSPVQMGAQPSIRELLQEGGYILYSRHGEATAGEDVPNSNIFDCSTQRNLSIRGRQQAVAYGEALRNMGIPIMVPVVTSPFCRTRETAMLAFGEHSVQIEPFLLDIYRLSGALNQTEQNRILSNLQSLLETPPHPGTNKVIIGHSFPPFVGLGSIPNMGTVIVRPHGQGNGYEVVAHITIDEITSWIR
ncbi:histidine phosphatase family protein [Alkalihalobacillus sp. MEB130]|uniref:histidine phosphatase family protein n=1 Tax=Alkalihalobacillus sp. MEB130 TaxID=2976704 RepID=UPI0028DEA520|nr:histidine phosphatase family protein [Alkalihalobacillus sp. MEB130]MDT8863007.1 histidine phosphatase family protein [Alkalihalobacillus sp. MEB130]